MEVILNLMLKEFDMSKNQLDLKNFKNLIKLLILDISPCLQKGIITVLIEFFRKTTDISELILERLISSNLIDYLLFNYSISLVDVRCFILALFKVILNYKLINCTPNKTQITEKIIPFIFENLFPTNLKAFKKDLLKSPIRERGLGVYSNKKINKAITYDNFNLDNKIELEEDIKEEIEHLTNINSTKHSEKNQKFNINIDMDKYTISAALEDDYITKKINYEIDEKDKEILKTIEEKEVLEFKNNQNENNANQKNSFDIKKDETHSRKISKDKSNNNINETTPIKLNENEEYFEKEKIHENILGNDEKEQLQNFRSPVFDTKIKQNKLILINKIEKEKEKLFEENDMETPIENPFDLKNSIKFDSDINKNKSLNLDYNEKFLELKKEVSNSNLQINDNKQIPVLENKKENSCLENQNEEENTISTNMNNKISIIEEIEEQTTEISNDMDKETESSLKTKKTGKKKTAGFSSFHKRNTVNISDNISNRLGLDIDAINEKYQFGGDKHKLNITDEESQKNYEEKIKLLAEHCVKFMNGEVNEIKCLDFSSDIFFREKDIEKDINQIDLNKNKFPGLYHTENE